MGCMSICSNWQPNQLYTPSASCARWCAACCSIGLSSTSNDPVSCACCCHCCQPDEAGAILNYYFGAANGDMFASAAMGYRHAFGLGVPKSCWSAVAYYKWVCLPLTQTAAAVHGHPRGWRPVLSVLWGVVVQ